MKTPQFSYAFFLFVLLSVVIEHTSAFVHPGILHTQEDIDRMIAKVNANESPWIDGWNKLIANSHAQTSYTPNPQEYVCCGGNACSDGESFMPLANDCAAAYQCALRYRISGNTTYAEKAIQIMNAWAATLISFTGDSNMKLRAGMYGYQFAAAAELLRDYSGWSATDFNNFKNMLLDKFYTPHNRDFLDRHNNTCFDHYWANWDLANMASCLAIAILCDDQDKFDHAIEYFKSGSGTGQIDRLCNYLYDGDPVLGQCQESGRDQGHATLCISLVGAYCQMAYNQGEDLFAYKSNKVLALCEYTAKYNLNQSVPFTTYTNCENNEMTTISSSGRGTIRPAWELIYNHYVNIKGLNAPYSQQWASDVRPEGGGGDYGSNSGGFDQLGFGTLTYTYCPPTTITPYISVDNGSWQKISSVTIDVGSTVKMGPQPVSGGSWSWTGCETSGTSREQTVAPTSSCTAIASYTNDCGTESIQNFDITVNTPITSGQSYVLSAGNSGQSMDVAGGSTSAGANIIQWPYNGGTNQQWELVDAGSGYYNLRSVLSSHHLDVEGYSYSDGANVLQWTANSGSYNQQLQLTSVGDGYYTLIMRHSGKCIEVANSSSSNGANIQQSTCDGGDNQKWLFELASLKSTKADPVENSIEKSKGFIFPNPVGNLLHIQAESGSVIRIFDGMGRLMLTNENSQSDFDLDISNLKPGVYFVRITGKKSELNKKLIKK